MRLVKDGLRMKTEDGRFSVTPVDEGTIAWIAGGRYMVDDSSLPLGESWARVKTLDEAKAWISGRTAQEPLRTR